MSTPAETSQDTDRPTAQDGAPEVLQGDAAQAPGSEARAEVGTQAGTDASTEAADVGTAAAAVGDQSDVTEDADGAEGDDAEGDGAEGDDAEGDDAEGDDAEGDDAEGDDATEGDQSGEGRSEAGTDQAGAAPRAGRSRKVAELEREGEIAADFLETLLDIADLDGDLEVDVEGDRAAVAIVDSEDGAAPQRLVGKEATVLEALQELTRLAVQAETGERSRLMLDVAGHRAARRAALVEQARQVTQQVRESGERKELQPMSAFERKVVHDEVLAAGLTSESEGEEPNRFVVVLPAG